MSECSGFSIDARTKYGAPKAWVDENKNYLGNDCLKWPFSTRKDGYGTIRHDGESMPAHRYMCIQAYGPAPQNKPFATHVCGNGHLGCVNPNHLKWASARENQIDRVKHGTSNRGEQCGSSKLTKADVFRIRERIASGEILKNIAQDFNVHPITITDIKLRRTWAWL